MIRINLAPPEELENKYWFVPDLSLLAIICLCSYFSVNYYLGYIEKEISQVKIEKTEFVKAYNRLKPDLERFAKLTGENELLLKKLNSLNQITVSKIMRYKLLIILEHLQNLKPEGLWFSHFEDDSSNDIIRLVGGAFDNLIVAEFMAALNSTKFQEVDVNDIRTKIYFSEIYLGSVSKGKASTSKKNEKKTDETKVFRSTQDLTLQTSKGSSFRSITGSFFPEVAKFPTFELNIKYKERSAKNENQSVSKVE